MRAEIIRFPKPKRKRLQTSKPRRRGVFYAGYEARHGPALCQDVRQIYPAASWKRGMEPHLLFPRPVVGTRPFHQRCS